jgi:LPXTG-motif cell wall-anchored protein
MYQGSPLIDLIAQGMLFAGIAIIVGGLFIAFKRSRK